jgi:aryl-alcohol dehydrogenase-like predicted oxidoreductase
VALAWLMARGGVPAPIASATTVAQVASFSKAAEMQLGDEDLRVLESASAA